MGLYLGGLIIGRIFASEIWGGLFSGGLIFFCIYLFIYLFVLLFFFFGGELIIGILQYATQWVVVIQVNTCSIIHPSYSQGQLCTAVTDASECGFQGTTSDVSSNSS